jgi:hypothetical protein
VGEAAIRGFARGLAAKLLILKVESARLWLRGARHAACYDPGQTFATTP